MNNFDKSILEVMIENGAVPYWIALFIGLILIGTFYWFLESDNKFSRSFREFIDNIFEEGGDNSES